MKFTLALALLGSVAARHHHHHHNDQFVSLADPLGKANEAFVAGKAQAANVVKTQEEFESEKVADVKSRDDADVANAEAEKNRVRIARGDQMNGGLRHQSKSLVYIPEEETYISFF
uniref:Uncharacterized protein n=1 Tax=Strombidium rassoulzadegani TaxID=1082188 RepID=A0A7S3CHB1_9SPIT|mmetsp:Transcript_10267/g.17266  ORF Transcript_10267/g.17266 Transcript_10267/m.17266 type:complete len:116 (+) Transcript_10267:1-348(+)|eukprot:CAMPEP_0168613384 /NCGR_PEP_ID=MMETSP0449_2-20121227/3422_1 /TAXON_ID=1082188 /ORGANISM="Strombidium rassoulzadegani, Strain ras09" /LENGTH=115 /DNA_ID=CAMNT_0008654013 /DNA_START=1 /DNA_END=348 /DNA_ORIENTATION=+